MVVPLARRVADEHTDGTHASTCHGDSGEICSARADASGTSASPGLTGKVRATNEIDQRLQQSTFFMSLPNLELWCGARGAASHDPISETVYFRALMTPSTLTLVRLTHWQNP